MSKNNKIRIVLNAPVILWFTLLCSIALATGMITNGASNRLVFGVYRSSLLDPLTYVRFIGHVFGHADVSHLINNLMLLLVLGPMLEEKYGSKNIIIVILTTALITGIVHFIFFPNSMLLGASGVVFAFILLASLTGFRTHEIPLTFILVAVLYLGQQIYQIVTVSDSVSQLTHIIGGCVGGFCGFGLRGKK